MKAAFLGGSFNPPHLAHQLACLLLLEAEGFDQVWLAPCYRHAFAKQLAPFPHRLRMCRLLARPFGGRVRVSEAERRVLCRGVNRTRHTLQYLSRRHPGHEFWLVIGSDLLPELHLWQDFAGLAEKFPVLVLRRAGYVMESEYRTSALELPAVSSSGIREALADAGRCPGLLPNSVAAYIERHGLYRRH